VDAEQGRIVLEGIAQARRVEVGHDYLDRTTLGGKAPALQHAYAVTTYCAQGATVDTAYVVVDPSMDKQESYVATSRIREQTYLYATPEIQAERNEYAPGGPERDAIAHVGEAAERDRAQTAAHDEALRAELAKLPTVELAARRDELGTPARFEARRQEDYARQLRAVDERRAQVERASADREAVEALGWRERRQKLPYATENERLFSERLAEERAKLAQMEPPGTEVRREREIAAQLLDARSAQALTAARIEPPSYIVGELGRGPPIRPGRGLGITACRESSATGSNTASRSIEAPRSRWSTPCGGRSLRDRKSISKFRRPFALFPCRTMQFGRKSTSARSNALAISTSE
jgi:hypothetical protein